MYKNCIPARTELGRLYVEQGRYEEAEKLFRECIEMDKGNKKSIPARNELALLYVQKGDYQKAKKMFSKISKLEKNNSRKKVEPKSKEEEENEIAEIFNKQIEEPTLEDEDILGKIRAKIHKGDISEAEIAEIERIKDTLEERQYNLIKIAIYEKLRMNKKALEIIKELEEKGQKDRVTNEIKERLKSKKIKAYDLGKWDEIIGWAQVAEVPEDGEIVLSEDKQVENENDEESIQGETIKKNLPEGVKNAIKEIMKKYYVKMQPQVGNNQERSKYIKRYDKLEILLETEEANKRAKMELMLMLVNEGYANIVKEKYPEEYEFIREVINQYKTKKIEAKEAIKKIDEYCI